ncbi:UNVERIFIED_CONTAM: G-type lectin S-receptor-like serine/threonine-protein kinase [Sesamum latifolium]|uniref:non-specific serine/threonine protein kinase n=1 Tax=Sesamum latifolium TaxID=2727402 RepID=A0AAW2TTF8_9LAMI
MAQRSTPDVVVWVANRNEPVPDSGEVLLAIAGNGELVISSAGRVVWSTNSSRVAASPVLQLLDTGNLVLVDRESESSAQGNWGIYFNGIPRFPAIFKPDVVFREDRLISMVEPYDGSILKRVTLEKSGFEPKSQQDWDIQDWSDGCTRARPLNCEGGDGFVEVSGVKHPDMLQFWLNSSMSLSECKAECLRNCNCTAYANPYITNGGSGCLIWFGDLIDTRDFIGMDSKQNIYIRVSNSEISETEFSTDLEKEKEKKRPMKLILISIVAGVLVSGFINGAILFMSRRKRRELNIDLEKEKEKKRPIKLILISMVSGVLVSGFINGAILLMTRRKRREAQKKNEDLELPLFKWTTIVAATNNFSRENIIGEGGFGPVYRGNLSAEEEIAVKRLSRTSGQGLEEFKTEVILIAKLQHRNLVRLLGCCIEGEERMLIYEYLPNKSLDCFVFDQTQRTLLTWPKRFDIIMGIARGLQYLHHDSRLKIIHRDLKTSNILLDENLNPKISDFGIARTFGENQYVARTKRVVGTYGYMAPEYAVDGKYSVKSDIFSFGVVLLEIVSGKKNRGFEHSNHYHSLLGHAWLLWKENKILELMDECMNDTFVESQVNRCIQVGLLCVQKFAEDRPVMSSVLFMLGTEGAILLEPKEPGFFIERSLSPVRSSISTSPKSVGETMTITDLEAR